jgi:hypothetical protein
VKYDAAANYQRMAETIRRQRALLERLEWAAGEYGDTCPACGAMTGTAPTPHTRDCWLAAELGRSQG